MENYESPYTSYPEGYKKFCHDMLPWNMRPMKKIPDASFPDDSEGRISHGKV